MIDEQELDVSIRHLVELAAWIDELHAKYFIPPKSVKHARASTRQRSKRRN